MRPVLNNSEQVYRFKADILSGKKTITIRNAAARKYVPAEVVQVCTHKDVRTFGQLQIVSVEPIMFNQLNNNHAKQENMSLDELRVII